MPATRWNRIDALFHAACEHEPAARDAFLTEACAGDAALLQEVRALLDADITESQRITKALVGATLELVVEGEQVGRTAGPYRLVRELGQGGMGAVYLAERTDGQFEQQVALKLIRVGMGTAEVQARFRMERQILARLQHPGIARLLDGGVTSDGQPFFAMEFVEGERIDAYCERHRLPIVERLALFGAVCDAVAYAHANLVVHRDLKPDNILVTAEGKVRLLDFGIAKVVADDTDITIGLTTVGSRAMTPAYASPEQVLGEQVGTASDVYSLGVLLYELICGSRPYNLKALSPVEMQRAVCQVDPPRPSSRVAESMERGTAPPLATGASLEATDVRRLERQVEGDLDVIAMKALRKEPERRYATVAALLDDIRRHLQGDPVQARPDTMRYRWRTRLRRHRPVWLTAAATVILTLTVAAIYVQGVRRERDRARAAATAAEAELEALRVERNALVRQLEANGLVRPMGGASDGVAADGPTRTPADAVSPN